MSLKLFGKNAVVYATGNIGLRAVAFLLIPLYTHSLSMRDYGLLMTLVFTNEFMLIAMNCGMRPALVRFAAECARSNRIAALLGCTCLVNLLGGLIVTTLSLTVFLGFFRSVLHSQDVSYYIGLCCCASVVQSLSIHLMDYYRARNESLRFMTAGLVSAGILLIASYIFLYVLRMGITGAFWARIATYAIILLAMSIDIFCKTGITISFSLIPTLARFGFPLVFSMSSELIIVGASIYFLSLFAGLEAVGVYALRQKLATVLAIVLILPFQMSFQPFIFANLETPNIKKQMSQLLSYLVLAISIVSFGILLGSRLLLPYIAPPAYFAGAYRVIILLLPGMAFIGIYYFAETLLTSVRQTKIIGLAMSVCAIISIMLNYVLTRPMQQYGAIIATDASYMLIGSTLFIIGEKKFPIPIELRRLSIATGLFAAIIILNLALLGVSNGSYYWISIAAIGSIGCVVLGSFCNDREKLLLKNAMSKAGVIVPAFLRRSYSVNPPSLTLRDESK